jgi:cysteine synthase
MGGLLTILEAIGSTPMVLLRSWDTPVPIYGKCEHLNPGGSVKDRLALALIRDGERRGRLKPGDTIVEATAGNTGIGLALVSAAADYKLVCVLPEKMSHDKRHALRAVGAEVIVTDNAPLDSPLNFRNVAERLAKENGWFLADQFRSQANVEAHFETTGPEIRKQLGQTIGAFVAGVGTGGTISGVGRYLKSIDPDIRIVLADPVGSALTDWINKGEYGADGSYAVEGIGSSRATAIMDRSVVDEAVAVTDEESFKTALQLQQKEGLLVGGSSGTAVAAAIQIACSGKVNGPIVALLADSWDRYFSQPWMRSTGT